MKKLMLTPNSPSFKIHSSCFYCTYTFLIHCWLVIHGLFNSFSQHFTSPPPSEVKRPSSLSSCPLKTDETIALVTEKVRKMDAR